MNEHELCRAGGVSAIHQGADESPFGWKTLAFAAGVTWLFWPWSLIVVSVGIACAIVYAYLRAREPTTLARASQRRRSLHSQICESMREHWSEYTPEVLAERIASAYRGA